MINKYLIGVDIGTQGTKAGLFRKDGTTVVTHFCASRLYQPAMGVVEEDPENQVKSVCRCIMRCVSQASIDSKHVAAIGIDGQMAGVIGIGADGHHVTPYDSWLDTRCAPFIDEMQRQAGCEIIRKTGAAPSFNHGPKKLWWKHERPRTFSRIVSFVQPGGYAVMRLCDMGGDKAFIDSTYLHFSGFADNQNQRWDKSLCHKFEFDSNKLPRIVAPSDVVGELSPTMAKRCGLAAGTPCVAGCGDTIASLLSSGATREGICVDIAGTASVFAATTAAFTPDTENGVLGWARSATAGLWHPFAYVNGGGMNLEWFVRNLTWLSRGKRNGAFDELNRQAEDIEPQIDDPLFIPHLGGRVMPAQPRLRGSWAGVTWTHTAGHMFRAILEAVALEYGVYKEALSRLNPGLQFREMRITGGGEKSAAWNRIKADALGIRIVQVSRPEGAPLGVAMLAGYGVGLFPSLDAAARSWITTASAVRPRGRYRQQYEQRLVRYQRLISVLDSWAKGA